MWTNDGAVANQGPDKVDAVEWMGMTIDLPDVSTGVMHPNGKGALRLRATLGRGDAPARTRPGGADGVDRRRATPRG